MPRALSICLLLLHALWTLPLEAQPAVPLSGADAYVGAMPDWSWTLLSADSALASGYAKMAADMYGRILAEAGDQLTPEDADRVRLGLCTARLAAGDVELAGQLLEAHGGTSPAWRLRKALRAYHAGDAANAGLHLEGLTPQALDPEDLPWFYLLGSAIDEAQGRMEESRGKLARARDQAGTRGLSAPLELAVFRSSVYAGEADEDMVAELFSRLESTKGQSIGFQYARLLAATLDSLGRRAEALAVLDEQILMVAAGQDDTRAQLLLLKALIEGPSGEIGQRALENILKGPYSRRWHHVALFLITNHSSGETIMPLLDGVIEAPQQHPALDILLLNRANLHIAANDLDAALADASRLLEAFPASELKVDVLRTMAYIAWNRQPPQYRTVAKHLAETRELLPPGGENNRIAGYIADCFYLNGDYESAADAYATARQTAAGEEASRLFFQQCQALIEAGSLELARTLLDGKHDGAPAAVWHAEWNLLDAMKRSGDGREALERVGTLLDGSTLKAFPELRLRLQWLQARLSIDTGQLEPVPAMSDAVLASLDEPGASAIPVELRSAIAARILMTKAQALFMMGRDEEGLDILDVLEAEYPGNEAAALASLTAARVFASRGLAVEALARLKSLAEAHPQSEFAPVALYEAALQSERRGIDTSLEEANALLVDLLENYPDSDLAYYAMLKRADLSRKLNDFEAAQILYRELLDGYPEHPSRARTEMSLADALAAQGAVPRKRSEAASRYERLFENEGQLPDVRAEAGFKWGMTESSDSPGRAAEAYWTVYEMLLREPGASGEASVRARYWIARTGLELAKLWEQQKRFDDAITLYNDMLTSGLPGQGIIQSQLERLRAP